MQTDANINTKALFIFLADWRDKFAKGSVVLRLLKIPNFLPISFKVVRCPFRCKYFLVFTQCLEQAMPWN